ncbi:MAG TPA: SLC13 family permease [Thermoanaerobaculia bacterium]|nr:SLC13 family permease [Thermoanaerobaculia bacterium]
MTFSILLVLALLIAAIVVFAFEWLSVDVATLILLSILVLSGILDVKEAFAGFSNEIVVILAAIFVLSDALMRTGVIDQAGQAIHRLAGGSEMRIVLCVMLVTAFISAFMNNTTTTAVVLPAALGVCRKSGVAPSKVLIPLAFASMLGGTCTLVGTSTNVAASAYLRSAHLEPFGLFEFLPVGFSACVLGTLYMAFLGRRFLPAHAEASLTDEYAVRQYLSELVVPAGSTLVGRALREAPFAEIETTVLTILRGERRFSPDPDTRLEAGDLLIVKASREGLLKVKDLPSLEIKPDLKLGDADLTSESMKVVEAILMPQSSVVGRSIKEHDFRRRFGVTVIALYRQGHALAEKLGRLPLKIGDVLLLQGRSERFAAIANDPDLWILQETEHRPARRRQGFLVVGLFVAALAAAGFDLLPLPIAFLLAAIGVLLLRIVTPEEAYGFIDWRLIILIAGMTAFGTAMSKTGAAVYLAGLIVHVSEPFGVTFLLAAFTLLTILLTQPMSNAAAALVVLPIALQTAHQIGANPRTFAVLVTLAASLSFVTPFEPSCLLVYGPGKYRFRDFVSAGLPLTALIFVLLLVLVPILWPLH